MLKHPEDLLQGLSSVLLPPKPMTHTEWADAHFILSEKNSGNPGRWRTRPYQKEILDSFGDPRYWRVSIMKSARVGYTKLLGIDTGYSMAHDPCPSSTVQPTIGDAESYSRDEIASMIDDVPVIKELFAHAKFRDGTNSLMEKHFAGGVFTLLGANSPGGFRRITRRKMRLDEVDGYPAQGAGSEGDQIELAINRTIDFHNRLIIEGSTPTIEDFSRIEKSFKISDQRRRFMPCPHCGHMQFLVWKNKDRAGGFWWEADKPETAVYICESCETPIQHKSKRWMDTNGEWRGTAIPSDPGHIGFHIWAAYSYQANATWSHLVRNYLQSKDDPLLYQTHINTWRGETWKDDAGSRITAEGLLSRRDTYKSNEVPVGVLALTVGVDLADDRFEVSIWGWGKGYFDDDAGPEPEGWLISHQRIHGSYTEDKVWQQLDAIIKDEYITQDGGRLKVMATCVDSGDGEHSSYVYGYTGTRQRQNVLATKGVGTVGKPVLGKGTRVDLNKKGRAKRGSAMVYIVGTDLAKTRLMARLRHIAGPGPGCLHFPCDIDEEYFNQLVSERQSLYYQHGVPKRKWVRKPGAKAETLDCFVYAYAGLHNLYTRYNRKTMWDQLAKQLEESKVGREEVVLSKEPAKARSFNLLT